MIIGSQYFKIKKDININDVISERYENIFRAYGRPSEEKINIYNYWKELLLNNCDKVVCYGIKSHNAFHFSLNAIVEMNKERYYIYITKTKNEIFKIIK